jgi:anti-sigma factor RsiW
MMACRELYGFLDDFLDGHLDATTRLKFEAHLLMCAKCRRYLATYRATLRAAREVEVKDAPAEAAPEELIRAILVSRTAPSLRWPPE